MRGEQHRAIAMCMAGVRNGHNPSCKLGRVQTKADPVLPLVQPCSVVEWLFS